MNNHKLISFSGIEETPTTTADRDKKSSSNNPPSSLNEILWSAVQQHHNLGAIPFGYRSHLRNWTFTELNSTWWVVNFWGRNIMPHKLIRRFWYQFIRTHAKCALSCWARLFFETQHMSHLKMSAILDWKLCSELSEQLQNCFRKIWHVFRILMINNYFFVFYYKQ